MVKTSLNIEENIESMLCYIGFFITGFVFLFAEKQSKTVKFHAKQSIFFFLPMWIIAIVLWAVGKDSWTTTRTGAYGYYVTVPQYNPGIPALVWVSYIIWIIVLVMYAILVITSYQGQKVKIPLFGDMADK